MIVRELFARLGLKVDKGSFGKADRSIDKVKTALVALGSFYAAGRVSRAISQVLRQASSTQEIMNVLNESFGEQAKMVVAWSETTAVAMGRSKFELREMAGSLGAMLESMVGSKEEAAEMSTTLAELSIDLASFFDTTDPEALAALKSGIVGMTMPLRRYGVVLLDATLAEFARTKGITKSVETMTNREKVLLRYQFILAETTTKQGDAARTLHQYAGATKALGSAWTDFITDMGLRFIPTSEKMVIWMTDALRGVNKLLKGTKILEVAMAFLNTAVGILAFFLGFKLMAALGAVALSVVKLAGAFTTAGGAALLLQIKAALLGVAFIALAVIIALAAEEIFGAFTGMDTLGGRVSVKLGELYDWFIKLGEGKPVIEALLIPLKAMMIALRNSKDFLFAIITALTGGGLSGFRVLGENMKNDIKSLAGSFTRIGSAVGGEHLKAFQAVTGALGIGSTVRPSPQAAAGGALNSSQQVTVNQTINTTPGQSNEAVGKASVAGILQVIGEVHQKALQTLLPAKASS